MQSVSHFLYPETLPQTRLVYRCIACSMLAIPADLTKKTKETINHYFHKIDTKSGIIPQSKQILNARSQSFSRRKASEEDISSSGFSLGK